MVKAFSFCRCGDRFVGSLKAQEQKIARRHASELTRRLNDPVGVENRRVIEKAVNPNPMRAILNPVIDGQSKLARPRPLVALAPEVELVDADD